MAVFLTDIQGGAFNPKQVAEFETLPYSREAVKVRIYDDKAKVVGRETRNLESFRPLVRHILA
jgi:predicted HD phosphohydrolase